MADPLSISASVAGLITLADVAFGRVFRYAQGVKNASSEITKLSTEIRDLSGTLHSLELLTSHLEEDASTLSIRVDHIHACQITLEKISVKLQEFSPRLPGSPPTVRDRAKNLKWPFSSSQIKELLSEVERHKSTFTLALTAGTMTDLVQRLSSGINDVKQILQKQQDFQTHILLDEERRKIIDHFEPANPTSNYKMALKLRHSGTGIWFIQGEKFQDWLRQHDSRAKLWLYGIPGAGKTVLAASIIQEVSQQCTNTRAFVFFYCDYKEERRKDPINILGSIAAQLARQNERAFNLLDEVYAACKPQGGGRPVTPEIDDLMDVIGRISKVFATVSIVIDGIDECDSNATLVTEKLAQLSQLDNIKTLFLSRDEINIRQVLDDQYTKVSIAAESSDIRLYVAAEISTRKKNRSLRIKSADLEEHIMETLVQKANGMFRWVACQLDYLCELSTDADRRIALYELPPTLASTYERILERVNTRSIKTQQLVRSALQWIVCSHQSYWTSSLSIDALCEALAVTSDMDYLDNEAKPDEVAILSACSSLIRRSEGHSKLELAHASVKEFLIGIDPNGPLSMYRIEEAEARTELAKTCLRYLCLQDFSSYVASSVCKLNDHAKSYPFWCHAVEAWPYYAKPTASSLNLNDPVLFKLMQRLMNLSRSTNYINWCQSFSWYYARAYANSMSSDDIFENVRINAISNGSNPIHYASMLRLENLVHWLLEDDYDDNVNCQSAMGTPLHCAIFGMGAINARFFKYSNRVRGMLVDDSTVSTIRILLKAGGSPSTLSGKVAWTKSSPLHVALRLFALDYNALRAISLMLETKDISDKEFTEAFEEIDEQLLERLHERGLQIDTLETASDNMEPQIQRLVAQMIHYRASTTSRNDFVGKWPTAIDHVNATAIASQPLKEAVIFAQHDVVREILSSSHLDLDCQEDETGETVLHIATARSTGSIVRLLLDAGANSEIKDKEGLIAFQYCGYNHNSDVFSVFIKHKPARLDSKEAQRIWHLAAEDNNAPVLRLLLENCAKSHEMIRAVDENGYTPTHLAASSGSDEALSVLLQHCNPGISTPLGETLIHLVSQNCLLETLDTLIKTGVDVHAVTKDGSTALHYWAQSPDRNLSVAAYLLENNVSNGPRLDGKTPLHLYFEKDIDEDVQHGVIIKLGSSGYINAIDSAGFTPLHYLISQIFNNRCEWHIVALSTMLKLGADIMLTSSKHKTPLQTILDRMVTLTSHEEHRICKVLDIVFQYHMVADDFSMTSSGLTVLGQLIKQSRFFAAEKLLYAGVSSDTCDIIQLQGSALHYALYYATSLPFFSRVLQHASTLEKPDKYGNRPLHWACHNRTDASPKHVEMMLKRGASINFRNFEGETPLALAVKSRRLDICEVLLDHGADPQIRTNSGFQIHHIAAENGFLEILPLIQNHGVDLKSLVDTKGRSDDQKYAGWNSIHLAARSGHATTIQSFLELPNAINIDLATRSGDTALIIASRHGSEDCVKLLLAKGGSVAAVNSSGANALHAAISSSSIAIVDLLLQNGCPQITDKSGLTPASIALKEGQSETLELLRRWMSNDVTGLRQLVSTDERIISPSQRSRLLLISAIEAGDLELCKREVSRGVDAVSRLGCCIGCTPLTAALSLGKLGIARYLLQQGRPDLSPACNRFACNVNPWKCGTAVHLAAASADAIDILRTLLGDIDPSQDPFFAFPYHPIHSAIANDNTAAFLLLLDHFSQHFLMKKPNSINRTASLPGNMSNQALGPSQLTTLLEIPMKIPFEDKEGYLHGDCRPLHLAVLSRSSDLVEHLLSLGANVDSQCKEGQTSVMLATDMNDGPEKLSIVSLLIKYGANVNVCHPKGQVLIALAIQKGHMETAKLLHEGWANLSHQDSWGDGLIDYCIFSSESSLSDQLCGARFLFENFSNLLTIDCQGSATISELLTMEFQKNLSFMVSCGLSFRSIVEDHHINPFIVEVTRENLTSMNRILRLMPRGQKVILINSREVSRYSRCVNLLYHSASIGDTNAVRILLQNGAETEIQCTQLEYTPLMAACYYGRFQVVKRLVQAGARTEITRRSGGRISAIDAAAHQPKVLRWLLVEQFSTKRLLTHYLNFNSGKSKPWSGPLTLHLPTMNEFYRHQAPWESALEYHRRMREAKDVLLKDGLVPEYYTAIALKVGRSICQTQEYEKAVGQDHVFYR